MYEEEMYEEEEYGFAGYLAERASRKETVQVVWAKPVAKSGVAYGIGGLPISV